MDIEPLFITDEFKAIVAKVNTALSSTIKFFYGEDEHVVKEMKDMKTLSMSITPMIALVLPVDIQKPFGGYEGQAIIQRIVIAAVTDERKSVDDRNEAIIKTIVDPIYRELLKQISKHKTFAVLGDNIEHTSRIRFGTTSAAHGFIEYIDGMEILGMKITLNANCI